MPKLLTALSGLAQCIVNAKFCDTYNMQVHQQSALKKGQSLLSYLVDINLCSAHALAELLAKSFNLPFFDLNCIDLTSIPLALTTEKLIRQHHILPLFQHGQILYLAMADPSAQVAVKAVQFYSGLTTLPVIVEIDKLTVIINQLLNEKTAKSLATALVHYAKQEHPLANHPTELILSGTPEDAPLIVFVEKILIDAAKKGVSDVHFEPYEHNYRIRYRMDGLLLELPPPPANLAKRITGRLKILANLDIANNRIAQDGRFKIANIATQSIDFRISTCPTVNGEKVVVRILNANSCNLTIDSLGLNSLQREQLLTALTKPQGMVIVTGPTGSGKTMTLYAALNLLNTVQLNISTIEDPVEIKINGLNQVNVDNKSNLTFANILRTLLRQDPDIIMVGEMRDLETAEIAIKAAQTGHLVLSTLHTKSAATALARLSNIGIANVNLANTLSLVVAQRLVRRLCNYCKVPDLDLTTTNLRALDFSSKNLHDFCHFKANGCEHCINGYLGRIGLFEIMPISNKINQLIVSSNSTAVILEQAQAEGMMTIAQVALAKIQEGITSIAEVQRVIAQDFQQT